MSFRLMMFEENYHDVETEKKKKKKFFFLNCIFHLWIFILNIHTRVRLLLENIIKKDIYTPSLKDTYLNTKNLKSN